MPRFWMRWLLGLCVCALALTQAIAETPLPAAHDLQRSAAAAAARGEPLVVMFSLPGCPWCERLRSSTYQWLVKDGHAVVQVEMVDTAPLRDFEGRPTTGKALARRYGVKLAPTVLFFGPGGRELADRLVGAGQPEFYGGEVDDAMKQGARRLAAQPAGS